MRFDSILSAGIVAILSVAGAHAAPVRVVATGDSLTVGYFPHFQSALDARRPGQYETRRVAIGGTDAEEYAGLTVNSQCGCGLTDMVSDVLALSPDVIVFMLGTNDSSFASGPQQFARLMPMFLDAFEATGARLILTAPPPILPTTPFYAAAEDRLVSQIDPLIRTLAAQRRLPLVDLRARDWSGLYHDSVHMTHPEGRALMADIVADAVVRSTRFRRRRTLRRARLSLSLRPTAFDSRASSVPEPAGSALLAAALSIYCARPGRKRRSA